jgi:hypothetical protein
MINSNLTHKERMILRQVRYELDCYIFELTINRLHTKRQIRNYHQTIN